MPPGRPSWRCALMWPRARPGTRPAALSSPAAHDKQCPAMKPVEHKHRVMISRLTRDPAETAALGRSWCTHLQAGDVLALHGGLGAGKTVLVSGLAEGLAARGPVRSPTFTLINEYPGPVALYHVDLYRIGSAEEALDLGLDEYLFGNGVTAIEWPERIGDLLPSTAWNVYFEIGAGQNERLIRL